jgi:hypothetical protein
LDFINIPQEMKQSNLYDTIWIQEYNAWISFIYHMIVTLETTYSFSNDGMLDILWEIGVKKENWIIDLINFQTIENQLLIINLISNSRVLSNLIP